MPLQPLLLSCSMDEITNLITIINNIPKTMVNKPALKTWDYKYSIQWNLLQDLIAVTSEKTVDSVLDSWFSILFSSSSPLLLSEMKVCFLPTLCSSFVGWEDEEYFQTMLSMVCKEMVVVNYWHLLETLYVPVCISLKEDDDYWLLLRVLIAEPQSQIEIYDSLGHTLSTKAKQVFLQTLFHNGQLIASSKLSNS